MKQSLRGFSLLEVMIGVMLGTMILSSALLLYTLHFKITITIKQQHKMIHLIRQSFLSLQHHVMRAGYTGPHTRVLESAFSIVPPGEHERLLGHTQAAANQPALSVDYAEAASTTLLLPIQSGDFSAIVSDARFNHTYFVIADSTHSETFEATVNYIKGKAVLSRRTPFEHTYDTDAVIAPWARMRFFLVKAGDRYTLYQYNRSDAVPPVALVDGILNWSLKQTGALLEMTLSLNSDTFTLWMASDYVSI